MGSGDGIETYFVVADSISRQRATKMRLKLILGVLVLAALVMPVTADKVDDLILDLKFGSSDVRVEAAWTLGEIGDARAVDPLIEALKDRDQSVRLRAAEALGRIGDVRAVDPLIEAAKDESRYVQLWAATSLVQLGKAEYFDRITAMLNDEDPDLYSEVIMALGETGDPRAINPLIEAFNFADIGDCWIDLQDYECQRIYGYAVRGLSGFNDSSVVGLLLEVLRDGTSENRVSAAQGLGNSGDPQAIGGLTYAAQNDKNYEVRAAAEESLEILRRLDPVPFLISDLQDGNRWFRSEAAIALGLIGDARAVDPLIEALKDESGWVLSAAAKALEKIQAE